MKPKTKEETPVEQTVAIGPKASRTPRAKATAAKAPAKASARQAAGEHKAGQGATGATPGPKKDGSAKSKKIRLIRDRFTMPEADYGLIAETKQRCLALGHVVKKSEVLRAAIVSFSRLSDSEVEEAMAKLNPVKIAKAPKVS